MVDVKKQTQRKILRFKRDKFNELINKLFKFKPRTEGDKAFEEIYCQGVLVAFFKYENNQIQFIIVDPPNVKETKQE